MRRRWYIYVLKLEQDKWFVGISTNPERRYNQHVRGRADPWTRKYKPIQMDMSQDLETTDPRTAQYVESMMIEKLQAKYGRSNVEGGDTADITKYVRRMGVRFSERQWEAIIVVVVVAVIVTLILLEIQFHLLEKIRSIMFV